MKLSFGLAWGLLTLATVLSWSLDESLSGAWVGNLVLLVAFFKARVVLRVFMEVGDSAPVIRYLCDAWLLLACTVVIATYWLIPMIA